MVYTRIFNSDYAKYKRASGATVNFAIPRRTRANFMGPGRLDQLGQLGMDAFQGIGNAGRNAMQGVGDAFGNATSYLQGQGPIAGLDGIKNTVGGFIDDGGAALASAGDAVRGTIGSAGDMLMNGQLDPAEMGVAALGGLGAVGAGIKGLARRGAGAAEAVPQGLRAKVGQAIDGMSTGQRIGAGAAGAAGLGAAGLGAASLMRDDEMV
jgi:hypothetical protein